MRGLDLFSGIGGISLALRPYVQTVAYCEIEPYCQAVLLERMQAGDLDNAPIWNDVRTLNSEILDTEIDIICGGFPCQDVSVAGKQAGIAQGTRSGLFHEIMRLVDDFRPKFVFLENVAAICSNGLDVVLQEIAKAGYDARWMCLSAAEVGAPQKRDRWWLLAYAQGTGLQGQRFAVGIQAQHTTADCVSNHKFPAGRGTFQYDYEPARIMANAKHVRRKSTKAARSLNQTVRDSQERQDVTMQSARSDTPRLSSAEPTRCDAVSAEQGVESRMGRNVDGLSFRTHRIKALGNAVVPQAARKAFETLMFAQDNA